MANALLSIDNVLLLIASEAGDGDTSVESFRVFNAATK
jgi:hypothetical protein